MSATTIAPGDNVRFATSDILWHVWTVAEGTAFIATPNGAAVRGHQPIDRLIYVERPNCRCHPQEDQS